MFKNVGFNYSKTELGWVSDEIPVSADKVIMVSLSKNGIIVMTQQNSGEREAPKVCITEPCKDAELPIRCDEGVQAVVRVITSVKPKIIKYANI